jgi:hypothetical protein
MTATTHALGQFLRTLPHSAAATFLALFPIVDPPGGVPIFFSMTSSWTDKDRRITAFKTGLWVFVILVTFLFFLRHLAARPENCRRTDRRQYGLGHGHFSCPHHSRGNQ